MALFDYVQSGFDLQFGDTASVTKTLTAGNLVVAFGIGTGGGPFTFSDGTNTYVIPSGITLMAYALNVAGGSTTIALVWTGSTRTIIEVIELVGDSGVTYDTGSEVTYPFSGSYTSLDSGAISTASASEGLVGAAYYQAGPTFTEGSGFTQRENQSDTFTRLNLANQTSGGSGSYSYIPTLGSGAQYAYGGIVAFKPAGGGGGGHPMMRRWGGLSGMVGGKGIGQSGSRGGAWGRTREGVIAATVRGVKGSHG